MLSGLKYQLLEQLTDGPWFDVRVPAVVVEELVAIHERRAVQARVDMAALRKTWRALGLEPPAEVPSPTFDYRAYLLGRFDERLDFSVLPWPTATHDELVRRAVTRTRPFDEKGGGYRDALIWHDVLALARDGSDVALVTSDRAFLGDDGGLAPSLAVEVAPLAGSVELVRDFSAWLLGALPWEGMSSLSEALSVGRQDSFLSYYLQSDFQDNLFPTVEDLGFWRSPGALEVLDVAWDGSFIPARTATVSDTDGAVLVEYDLGQQVEFRARFASFDAIEPQWQSVAESDLGGVVVEAEVKMIVRVAVLFGGEYGFSIEEVAWRRGDGAGPGASLYRPEDDPNQPPLW